MPKPETRSFEERVRDELGEGANPIHIQSVLDGDDAEILSYISNQCENAKGVIAEAFHYFEPGNSSKLELGTRILKTDFKRMLFVLREFRKRRGFDDERTD